MASPVDTSVKFFHSDMANAPVLSGTAGTMLSVLDACLKDGFDLKTATSLVVSGGVATLVFAGTHSSEKDAVILVAGSSIAALNGEQKVTARTSASVSFATAAADGTATGTITFRMAPLGWLKPFSGTNLGAYKSADPTSTGCFLRVDDTGTVTCRVVGYENMTDISTGTGPFPTAAQMSGGGYWQKSQAASAVAARWFLAGDSKMFMIYVAPYVNINPAYVGGLTRGFGDPIALRPSGDPFGCVLSYANAVAAIEGAFDGSNSTTPAAGGSNVALPRPYTALGGSELGFTAPYVSVASGVTVAVSGVDSKFGAFPSPIDGSLQMCKRYIASSASGQPPRLDVSGIYHCSQNTTWPTITYGFRTMGTGPLASRVIFALTPSSNIQSNPSTASNAGVSFVDITGPWR